MITFEQFKAELEKQMWWISERPRHAMSSFWLSVRELADKEFNRHYEQEKATKE